MAVVVADSSSFIHLAAIGRVGLLRELYGYLIVPLAVWQEVVVAGRGRPGETELRGAVEDGWVSVEAPSTGAKLPIGAPALHSGEGEAVRLACSKQDSLLLLDERSGRSVATGLGVKVVGIVGVLVLAKRRGLIPSLAVELQRLRSPGGFRISTQLFEQALRLVRESS